MKLTLAIATILAAVSAQSIPGLPSCGSTCMITAAMNVKDCGYTDAKCFCGSAQINDALKTCVPKQCQQAADVKTTYDLANKSCAGAKGYKNMTPPVGDKNTTPPAGDKKLPPSAGDKKVPPPAAPAGDKKTPPPAGDAAPPVPPVKMDRRA